MFSILKLIPYYPLTLQVLVSEVETLRLTIRVFNIVHTNFICVLYRIICSLSSIAFSVQSVWIEKYLYSLGHVATLYGKLQSCCFLCIPDYMFLLNVFSYPTVVYVPSNCGIVDPPCVLLAVRGPPGIEYYG